MAPIFAEISDSDSITTESTEDENDSEREWEIEKILTEHIDSGGCVHYLIKWSGFPLGQSTWEQSEGISGCDVVLNIWKTERKRLTAVRHASIVDDYQQAYEDLQAQKEERKARREAKRRKRAARNVTAAQSSATPSLKRPLDRSIGSSRPVKRKGIAEKIVKKRLTNRDRRDSAAAESAKQYTEPLFVDDDSHDSHVSISSSPEPPEPNSKPRETPVVDIAAATTTTTPATSTTVDPNKGKSLPIETPKSTTASTAKHVQITRYRPDQVDLSAKPTIKTPPLQLPKAVTDPMQGIETIQSSKTTSQPVQTRRSSTSATMKPALDAEASQFSKTSVQQESIRRTSTSETQALPKSKVFAGDWAENKKSRQDLRFGGEIPKNSKDQTFNNLAVQHRFQKYAGEEPVPNPEFLSTIDPKTRKSDPPQRSERPSASNSSPTSGIPTKPAYSRTQAVNCRPLAKLCLDFQAGYCKFGDSCRFAHSIENSTKSVTCAYWARPSGCRKTETECDFAHYDTGRVAATSGSFKDRSLTTDLPDGNALPFEPRKKSITCAYWAREGGCHKTAEECEFAHYDTGVVADTPGSFRSRPSISASSKDKCLAHNSTTLSVQELPSTGPPVRPPVPTRSHTSDSASRNANLNSTIATASSGIQAPVDSRLRRASVPSITSNIQDKESNQNRERGIVEHNISSNTSTPPRDPRLQKTSVATTSTDPKTSAHNQDMDSDKLKANVSNPKSLVPRTDSKDPRLGSTLNPVGPTDIKSNADSVVWTEKDSARHAELLERQFIPRAMKVRTLLFEGRKADEPARLVMLAFQPHRKPENDVLSKWFHKLNRTVYSSLDSSENWNLFRADENVKFSVVIVHPEETFRGTLPHLHRYLMSDPTNQVFSMGVSCEEELAAKREGREPIYSEERLFARGYLTFISDDVFYYYPEKATAIIKRFHQATSRETCKIGARPGIKRWLRQLADDKFREQGGPGQTDGKYDWRWRDAYDAIMDLCPSDMDEKDVDFYQGEPPPLPTSYLYSEAAMSLPSFQGLWETDQEASTELLVKIFAGYACDRAQDFRQSVFVYARPDQAIVVQKDGEDVVKHPTDPKGWMRTYNHIGVITPEKMLDRKGR